MADDDNKLSIPRRDDDDEREDFDPPILNQHTMQRWVAEEDDTEPMKPEIPIQQYERPPVVERIDEDFHLDTRDYLVMVKTSTNLKICLLFTTLWALGASALLGVLWFYFNLGCLLEQIRYP
jgi:hypothetical protein